MATLDDRSNTADASDATVAEPIDDDAVERRSATVDARWHGERLDRVLVSLAGEFSRNHLQTLIESGQAHVDGVETRSAARRVRAGQTVSIALVPTAESRAFRPERLPLVIRHEDEDLLVVDKAAGMVVHPAAGNWSGTLLNALLAHHPGAAALPRAGIVHRLDKDTSGLMVVGKTLPAVTALVRAIAARDVRREYLALALGTVRDDRFTVEAPIGRDPQTRIRMAVAAGGKPARTDVEVLGRADGITALRCRLHTGRTHQIRVHLASRGHPLVADALYGGGSRHGLQRQALHAARLGLAHPASGASLLFDSPLPPDLATAWRRILPSDDASDENDDEARLDAGYNS